MANGAGTWPLPARGGLCCMPCHHQEGKTHRHHIPWTNRAGFSCQISAPGSVDTWVVHQDAAGHGAPSATPSFRQPRCAPAWCRGCPPCCAGSWAALCSVTRHQSGASCPTGRTCPRPRPRRCLAHPRWLCVAHLQQRCHLPALPHANPQMSSGPSSKGPRALRCRQSPLPELRGHPQHIPRHNARLRAKTLQKKGQECASSLGSEPPWSEASRLPAPASPSPPAPGAQARGDR